MPFSNRWLITGRLTTLTPLHIGNGGTVSRVCLDNKKTNKPIEIGAVAADVDERAYIPGTTLKGNLRAWAKERGFSTVESLFGSEDSSSSTSVGGKVEFWDAPAGEPPVFHTPPPYWESARRTGVTASVSINRRTRTASEEMLLHEEYVPPGVPFTVTITALDLNEGSRELEDLIFILNGFNDPVSAIALGSSTGDGWGRFAWDLVEIKRIRADEVNAWISGGATTVGYNALSPLPETEKEDIIGRARAHPTQEGASSRIMLRINLDFETNFLVNDPSQTNKAKDESSPDHAPLRDTSGRVLLPARSIRGALRSQAEKILRTLGGEMAACYLDGHGPRKPCESVYELADLTKLCPACQVFALLDGELPSRYLISAPCRICLKLLARSFPRSSLRSIALPAEALTD